jgi:hypothetical protein
MLFSFAFREAQNFKRVAHSFGQDASGIDEWSQAPVPSKR